MPTLEASDALRFDPIEECIGSIRNGEFIIVVDSMSRENEGDLIIAAEDMTPEKMAFMVRFSSGIICTPLTPELATTLALPPMVPPSENRDPNTTAYTISIDGSAPSITTGISAADRSLTCQLLANPASIPGSFRRPGHVFPLVAKDGGVLVRTGHTEAAVDFCQLAGKRPVAVISEIVEDLEIVVKEGAREDGGEGEGEDLPSADHHHHAADVIDRPAPPPKQNPPRQGGPKYRYQGGTSMLRRNGCLEFGAKWGIKCCTIEDLVLYREAQREAEQEKTKAKNGSIGMAAATTAKTTANGVNGA